MRTDGLFTLHSVTVNYKPGDVFTLMPFGDVHRDSPAHSDDVWKEFLDRARTVKNPLFLGLGDYFDSYSTSERRIIGNPDLHESTAKRMEQEARGRVSALAKELSFMRGKLIGLLSGNHYAEFIDGTTSDTLLANKLSTNFLGVCCAIRITFNPQKEKKNPRSVSTVDIFAHHGKGGGITAGGRMLAVERMTTVCEADIFLMGDNHARGVLPLGDKLRIGSSAGKLHLRHRRCWIGRTGSFLRGYVDGESSYVVDRALPPASLGWIEFTLTPVRIRDGGVDRRTIEIGSRQ